MKKINILFFLLALTAAALPADIIGQRRGRSTPLKPYSISYELEQLKRVDMLPVYRPGVVEQVSTSDPTGGPEDGCKGTYSYIR